MFALKLGSHVLQVHKIREPEFSETHHDLIAQVRYEPNRLVFSDARWHSLYLGAGEEKAVFCVCDHHHRVFAVELIDERHYLNGRFVGGQYFFSQRLPALTGVKAQPDSEFGLTFTGLIKVREFVHGYEWSRFQFDPQQQTAFDGLLTAYLQSFLLGQFRHYQAHYRDVHERNVLFEIRDWHLPGIPVLLKTWEGRLRIAKIGLQPVDVR